MRKKQQNKSVDMYMYNMHCKYIAIVQYIHTSSTIIPLSFSLHDRALQYENGKTKQLSSYRNVINRLFTKFTS